jgi:NhaP-type Na+/H+ or K+/H+ antiporter
LLAVLLTVAVVIVARFVWVFPAIYLPRRLSPKLARRDPAPPWQWVFFRFSENRKAVEARCCAVIKGH